MLLQVSILLTCCPPNQGRPTHHCIHAVSSGTGAFAEWAEDRKTWRGADPIAVWDAFENEGISELSNFRENTDLYSLWMHMRRGSQVAKLLGHIGSTEVTAHCQTLDKAYIIQYILNIISEISSHQNNNFDIAKVQIVLPLTLFLLHSSLYVLILRLDHHLSYDATHIQQRNFLSL